MVLSNAPQQLRRPSNQLTARSRTMTDSTTDFWGPASNFGIPLAAIADMKKDPEMYVTHNIANAVSVSHVLRETEAYNLPVSLALSPHR
jgi:hypothetical protein